VEVFGSIMGLFGLIGESSIVCHKDDIDAPAFFSGSAYDWECGGVHGWWCGDPGQCHSTIHILKEKDICYPYPACPVVFALHPLYVIELHPNPFQPICRNSNSTKHEYHDLSLSKVHHYVITVISVYNNNNLSVQLLVRCLGSSV
jgi:hypothetical protein